MTPAIPMGERMLRNGHVISPFTSIAFGRDVSEWNAIQFSLGFNGALSLSLLVHTVDPWGK